MMFADVAQEVLGGGQILLVVLVAVTIAFAVCFAMALSSLRRARQICRTKTEYDALLRQKEELSSERDALLAEIRARGLEREEYARAQKFLEMKPHLEAEQEKLEKFVAQKEVRLAELNDSLKGAADRRRELEKAENDLKQTVRELADLQRDKTVLAAEKAAEEKKVADLRAERKQLESELAELRKKSEDAQRNLGALKSETEALEARKKASEKWLADNRDRLARCDDLDAEIARKQEEIKSLGARLDKGEKAISDTLDRIDKGLDRLNRMNLSGVQTLRLGAFAGLRDGVFAIGSGKGAASSSLEESAALEQVAQHIEAAGFVVPPRLLNAFHASLKTSDMSSLTVMAGVSGTGKSALPKLYSEAMGIHFQPLAVEPRWDSPKDLLGFFNYVTNRYEPTALARALFQFQGLHDEAFRPDPDMSEYMLMPMLDEMNLARIEYYFSEFLSKLEMRRLVAPLTRENLGVVALEVFQGYAGKDEQGRKVDEPPIRLFANQNTLFVGTMNEDETTQSLSDKVIDRANVLYFGRPATLRARAGGAADISFRPLRKKTWDAWRRPTDEGELKFASTVLSALNRTLADFNRPFAHRTFQAMLAYIANYPVREVGEDRDEVVRRALADQIGMRIMPKLYGVDLTLHQNTFEQVRRNLAEVGDPLLNQAFDNASNRDLNKSGFFHWTGFDWNG